MLEVLTRADPSSGPLDPFYLGVISVLLATVATVAIRQRLKSDKPLNSIPQPTPTVSASPLADFSGTQNEFMKLQAAMIQELRDTAEADRNASAAAIAAMRAEFDGKLAALALEVSEERKAATTYRRAVTRFLAKVYKQWQGPTPFPRPDDEDLEVLGETIPAASVRRQRDAPA